MPEDDAMAMKIEEPAETDPLPGSNGFKSRTASLFRRGARTIGLILLTFVAWVWVRAMADPYGYLSVDPAVLIALGLVAAGVLLLRGQQPTYDDADETARVAKPSSPLGVLTLSLAFLVVGGLILAGNLEAADITIGHITAAALTVVGLGLLVGAWWGHSRFLIVVGVVLVPFVIAGGFMPFPLKGSVGDQWIHSRNIDDVDAEYEVLVGTVHMNFADLRSFSGEREIDISIAGGNATVFIPEKIALTVTGHIEWGNATIGHGRETGEDLVLQNDLEGQPGAGHLTINFTGGIASLYVERISYRELHGPLPGSRRDDKDARGRKEDRGPKEKREAERRRRREKT